MSGRSAKTLRRLARRLRGDDPAEQPYFNREGTYYGSRWYRLYRAYKRAWNRGDLVRRRIRAAQGGGRG